MSKSPLTQVREQFGSKKELATKLLPLLDRRDGETEKEFAARIQGASNKQLLRLSAVEEKVKATFGSKDALVDAIVALKFGKPNADYKSKLSTFTKAKLLDLHGSLSKPTK
jgi:hypothetical protein